MLPENVRCDHYAWYVVDRWDELCYMIYKTEVGKRNEPTCQILETKQ